MEWPLPLRPPPGGHPTLFPQSFVAFAHSFYTALGREPAGWDGEDGDSRKEGGNGEGGRKLWGPGETRSLPLIYYEYSWETASRLESE